MLDLIISINNRQCINNDTSMLNNVISSIGKIFDSI